MRDDYLPEDFRKKNDQDTEVIIFGLMMVAICVCVVWGLYELFC